MALTPLRDILSNLGLRSNVNVVIYAGTCLYMPCGELVSFKGKLADLEYTGGFGPPKNFRALAESWRRVGGFSDMLVDFILGASFQVCWRV
jgi:hypothetical protein